MVTKISLYKSAQRMSTNKEFFKLLVMLKFNSIQLDKTIADVKLYPFKLSLACQVNLMVVIKRPNLKPNFKCGKPARKWLSGLSNHDTTVQSCWNDSDLFLHQLTCKPWGTHVCHTLLWKRSFPTSLLLNLTRRGTPYLLLHLQTHHW